MFQVVIEDITFDPGQIGLLSAVSVVLASEDIPDLVEEFLLGHLTPLAEIDYAILDYSLRRGAVSSPKDVVYDNA